MYAHHAVLRVWQVAARDFSTGFCAPSTQPSRSATQDDKISGGGASSGDAIISRVRVCDRSSIRAALCVFFSIYNVRISGHQSSYIVNLRASEMPKRSR